MLDLIINSFWLILPSYFANFIPVLLKGKKPIDFKKNFIDGNRLLGDGKTIEGSFGGFFGGLLIGLLQIYFQPYLPVKFYHNQITIILLSFGAVFGDLFGSFIKRRFNLRRGRPAPLLDQLDFLIFSLVLVSLVAEIELNIVIFLVIVTPIIHFLSNIFAYLFKLKGVPW